MAGSPTSRQSHSFLEVNKSHSKDAMRIKFIRPYKSNIPDLVQNSLQNYKPFKSGEKEKIRLDKISKELNQINFDE